MSTDRPRIKLIYPTHRPLKHPRFKNLAPPYNLAVVAANTPPEADVEITDAYVERIDYRERVDLVGITSLTASIAGAIDIARRFRRRGVPVVMGGIHPTALPEETLQYCDAVVAGEAETTWPALVRDFMAGRMKSLYACDRKPDLAGMPLARRDLLNPRRYWCFNLIETSRGCPFDCMYCSDSTIYGPRYRFRPVEDVVEDIRSLPTRRLVVFLDNNIVGNRARAKELFRALIPLKIRWVGQASITMAYDEELLDLAARSGCLGVLVGLETLRADVLAKIGKPVDPGKYKEYIARIQKRGIFVQGEFIFGFDEDDPGVFRRTVDFAEEAKLGAARFAILKPYPGTRLYTQLLRDGRITTCDWANYHTRNVVFRPKQLTVEELVTGRDLAYRRFASPRSMLKRLGFRGRRSLLMWAVNVANMMFRNSRSR